MNKCIKFFGVAAALASLAGCNATQQQNMINTAAGAALGAGVGMAVSSEKDKEEGALVGAGTGAILAGLLTDRNNANSRAPAAAAETTEPVGSVSDVYNEDPMEEVLTVFDRALQASLTSGREKSWSHLDFSGTIYPGRVREQFGRTCRPYRSAWRSADGSGTDAFLACRGANGKWETSES